VEAAHEVTHRLDVVQGLRHLLHSDETKRVFREVDQLHPIVASEIWLFGDEWQLSRSESGLTAVVLDFLSTLGGDVEFAPKPVKLGSGKKGRVDLLLHRERYEDEDRTRHLVIELKRPMRCTMREYSQLYDYAVAITGDPRVADTPHIWDFWLLATELDESLSRLRSKPNQERGLVELNDKFRVWIFTWGQMLDRAERRLEFFRKQLNVASEDDTALRNLRKIYRDFIPGADQEDSAPSV
jgi:hypothetical protein